MSERLSLKREMRRQSAASRAVEQIKELISSGDLAPGDQLLSERQLAERLEISRGSVREALAILVGMGIIEVNPRDGAYIRRRNLEDAVEPLAEIVYRERESVMHIFEVRLILETQAARLAAERRDEADIRRLRELVKQLRADGESGRPTDESDIGIHVAILDAAKNPWLSELLAPLVSRIMEVYGPIRRGIMSNPLVASGFFRDHELIIDAIADANPDLAVELMTQHLERARQQAEERIR